MRAKVTAFVMIILLHSVLNGQTAERVFRLSFADTQQDTQGMLQVIRGIAVIQHTSQVAGEPAIAVRGTADQIAMAEWLVKELDRSTTPQVNAPLIHEYRVSSGTDDLVRVFYLHNAETVQQLNEAATLIRSIGELRQLLTYASRRAIALRATADQIALADWLIHELDQPADSTRREFRLLTSADDLVRMFRVRHSETTKDFNELATLIRSIGQMRRLFTNNSQRAIALRGTPEQIAFAEWMINELDKPANGNPANCEYRLSSNVDDHVGLIYVKGADINETARQLRAQGQIQSVFTYHPQRAIAVRGTANQIAVAEGLTLGR